MGRELGCDWQVIVGYGQITQGDRLSAMEMELGGGKLVESGLIVVRDRLVVMDGELANEGLVMVGNLLGSLGGKQLVMGMELVGSSLVMGELVMVGRPLVVVGLVMVDGLVTTDDQCTVCTIESNSGLSIEGYARSEG